MTRLNLAFCLATTLAVVAVTTSGCRGRGLFPPKGPMNVQQAEAVIHDPYPQNDIAPYEAAARPPGYENPLPEPVRNQIVPEALRRLGRGG